jgi:hypothetical protein
MITYSTKACHPTELAIFLPWNMVITSHNDNSPNQACHVPRWNRRTLKTLEKVGVGGGLQDMQDMILKCPAKCTSALNLWTHTHTHTHTHVYLEDHASNQLPSSSYFY